MKIDVAKAISDLLFENKSVLVPGLGGFTTAPQSASVDYLKGVIKPPSRKLEFNPNLVVNDGVLVNHISAVQVISFEEAEKAVVEYVDEIKASLAQRKIIELPMVGRLYTDYDQNTRFLPEGSNFNPDAFGLPDLQFTPVPRQAAAAQTEADYGLGNDESAVAETQKIGTESQPAIATSASGSTSSTFKPGKWAPWLVLASAIVLAFAVWWFLGKGTTEPLAAVQKDRINVKPSQEEKIANTPEESKTETGTLPTETNPPNKAQTEPATTTLNECFIVVHSFGVKANAVKFAKQLEAGGYTPETKVVGPLHRVGIVFKYKNRDEVERMINTLGRKYDAGPTVFGED